MGKVDFFDKSHYFPVYEQSLNLIKNHTKTTFTIVEFSFYSFLLKDEFLKNKLAKDICSDVFTKDKEIHRKYCQLVYSFLGFGVKLHPTFSLQFTEF